MQVKTYSLNIHWDKCYPKAGTIDLCPIQLAVNLKGLQFKVSLKLYATKEEYDKAIQGKGGSVDIRVLRKQIQDYITKAELILEKLPEPTREIFQRLFKSETDLLSGKGTDITFLFNEYITRLEDEERIKRAQNMEWALKSLKKYSLRIVKILSIRRG